MWEVSGSGPSCQSGYRVVTYEATMVKIMVIRVEVTHEAMKV